MPLDSRSSAEGFGQPLNNPRSESELRHIGWEEYVQNLKQPYPEHLLTAAAEARKPQADPE
jgi:hypothetical protein